MSFTTIPKAVFVESLDPARTRARIQSIDLLRGIVMIIMALDHVRDYFHYSAFVNSPTDLSQTTVAIFMTRWVTNFCAPVFVFLAGISAHLYGVKNGKAALTRFLLTRGLWLVFVEVFIVTLGWTFNPTYPFFNLQVIWATGIGMIVLAGLIYLNKWLLLLIGLLLVGGHNLLDTVHVNGKGLASFCWALLHEPGYFTFGRIQISVRYPLMPWIGLIALGYAAGRLYTREYVAEERKRILLVIGSLATVCFVVLRAGNWYGESSPWEVQENALFSFLSFLNVTKYPPSLLYVLITLGPALIFLAISENWANMVTTKISVLGRVPMFYYLLHIFLIHFLAMLAATLLGYHWSDMILTKRVNSSPQLRGYGFDLIIVYMVWISVVAFIYPFCQWFDNYKKANQGRKWWLSYL